MLKVVKNNNCKMFGIAKTNCALKTIITRTYKKKCRVIADVVQFVDITQHAMHNIDLRTHYLFFVKKIIDY